MKTLKSILIIGTFCIAAQSSAQNLLIRYDFLADKSSYFHISKGKEIPISTPIVKRNFEVRIEVINLNPFVFKARCNWKQTIEQTPSTFSGLASILPAITMPGGQIGKLLSGLNMDKLENTGERNASSWLDNTPESKLKIEQFNSHLNELIQIEQQLLKLDFINKKIAYLRFNPYLPSDSLKAIANQMILGVMGIHKPSTAQFMSKADDYSAKIKKYTDLLESEYQSIIVEYKMFAMGNPDFREKGFDLELKKKLDDVYNLKKSYSYDNISKKLDEIEQYYNSIAYTPFVYICNTKALSDDIMLDLDIFEISNAQKSVIISTGSAENTDTLKKIRTKRFNVKVKGDIKINTSVGLGFPSYFNHNQLYTNKDSIITSSSGNNFAPTIGTFVNFYPYTARNVQYGGTFGVGIPLDKEGTGSINFFLGGSMIMGNANKVVLSGGVALGQLRVLDKNLKPGDKLQSQFEQIPLRNGFKPGAFLALSFQIAGK